MFGRINFRVDFTKLFSLSKELMAQSVWRKNCRLISLVFSPSKFARDVSWNLPNLCAICQTPFAKKGVKSWALRAQMLIKSTRGVNFTNILRAAFSYESFTRSFFEFAVKVKLFIGATYKMLVKLTPCLVWLWRAEQQMVFIFSFVVLPQRLVQLFVQIRRSVVDALSSRCVF